jgi:glycosyltransferase involved in cell wall biosynthesis
MAKIALSVIIPAYNEEKNFYTGSLDSVYAFLKREKRSFELLLINDGSTDKTKRLLTQFAQDKKEVVVKTIRHAGKGQALITGMLAAKGTWRLFADFDQSTPIAELSKLMPFTKKGFDIVIGSRTLGKAKRHHDPLMRRLMGWGFRTLVHHLIYNGIHDTQCGFKLFKDKVAMQLFSSLVVCGQAKKEKNAYTGAIDVELLFLAAKDNYRVKEVPVFWQHVHTNRVNPVRDSARMFHELLKIRWTHLTGGYNEANRVTLSVESR